MYPYTRINASSGPRWRNRLSPILPWIFILGVVAGTMLPIRSWVHWPPAVVNQTSLPSETDTRAIWAGAANSGVRHPVDVIRTIDGDTFEALVHLWPGLDMTTRVRMRGIDAAEMKAACPEELRLAQAASARLHDLLGEGGVTIYNIGPDKYHGRIVADAATVRTPDVSAAMLASGHARVYHGGHRGSWCTSASSQ
jgi:endonuclease YncB( thermonuclease family)